MADGDPEDDLELDPPESDLEPEEPEVEQEQDDEPEPEVGEVGASGKDRQEPGETQKPSRRDSRIETLTNSVKEERQRRAELERRLDTLLMSGVQPRPQGETPDQRAQRLSLMSPEERLNETLRESEQRHAVELRTLAFSVTDGNDRAAFEAKATVDPLYAKWKPRVESELTALRQQGQNVDREKLMYYLIGKNAVEARGGETKRQRGEAQRRVNSQRTRPSNSGSDTAANRTRGNTLERRLENQSI